MLNVDAENKKDTKLIDIESIVDPDDVSVMLDRGSTSFLYPNPGKEEKVLQQLKKANRKGLRFYAKQDIPVEYHIKENPRTGPILLLADKGYFLRGVSPYICFKYTTMIDVFISFLNRERLNLFGT